jgi:hypothetical protein
LISSLIDYQLEEKVGDIEGGIINRCRKIVSIGECVKFVFVNGIELLKPGEEVQIALQIR